MLFLLFVHFSSRLLLTSSRGISCISVAVWSLERNCSGTAVGLDMFVNCSAMFFEAFLKSSFSFFYVLLVTTVALYHINDVFRVAVDVMINMSCFTGRIKCIIGKSVRYVVARQTFAVTLKKKPQGWLFCKGLRSLELTNKLLGLLVSRKETMGGALKTVYEKQEKHILLREIRPLNL